MNLLKLSSAALLSIVLTSAAHAQILTVPNFDFATNSGHSNVADGSDPDAIQYFTESSTGGTHYGNAGIPAPDGSTSGFINTDNSETVTLTNDLTADGTLTAPTFIAGDTYTFSLQVGVNPTNDNQGYDHAGNVFFTLTANGDAVGTATTFSSTQNAPNVVGGTPQVTFYDLTYTYTATSTDAGKSIGILISDTFDNASQTEFSHATITAPEPGTYALFLGGIAVLTLGFRLRRLVSL